MQALPNPILDALMASAEIVRQGVLWLDKDGNILGSNSHAARELGYAPEAFPQPTFFQVNPKMSFAGWRAIWAELLEKKQVFLEAEHINALGKLVPGRAWGVLVESGGLQVCQVLVESSAGLKEQDERLKPLHFARQCLDNASLMIAWADENARMLYANQAFCRRLGYPLEEVLRLRTLDLEPGLTEAAWRERWAFFQKNKTAVIETSRIAKSGEAVPVRLDVNLVVFDEKEFAVGFFTDLTGEREKQHRLAFESFNLSPYANFWLDEDFCFHFFNDNLCQLTGYSAEELKSMTMLGMSPDWTPEAARKSAARTGTRTFENQQLRRKDGSIIYIDVVSTPVHHDGKKYFSATARNVTEKLKAEEEQKLAFLSLRQSPDPVYWVDERFKFQFFNESLCRLTVWSAEELGGMAASDLYPEWDYQGEDKAIAHLESVGSGTWEGLRLRRKDGALLQVDATSSLLAFGSKKVIAVSLRDVTEKRKAEADARLFYETLNRGRDMIFWLNRQGEFVFANDSLFEQTGYRRGDISRMLDLFPEFNFEQFLAGWERIRQAPVHRTDLHLTCKDGRRLPVESFISLVTFEGEERSVTILRDISERKKAEEDASLFLQTLYQGPDAVFWNNEDGSFRFFNQAFCELTGCAPVEGDNVRDFFPGFTPELYAKYWKSAESGKKRVGEYLLQRKDGSTIPVESRFSIVSFEGKNYACSIVRDITERKRKDAELRASLEEIERLRRRAEEENILLKEEVSEQHLFSGIVSKSPSYRRVLRQVELVAPMSATVLLTGETGTGKELLAKAIHETSPRKERPLVKVNCGALPPSLIESELFGHEKGAFTGAVQQKPGRFELADGGTLFLDEISELPLDLQVKLLRALQEGEFERVGGTKTLKVDVRLIAATNRDLESQVAKGKFREDLFYRLNVFPIHNLPLRERLDDIPLLVEHFVKKCNHRMGKRVEEIPPEALRELARYEFPGNVRELENIVERSVILSKGKTLVLSFQPPSSSRQPSRQEKSGAFPTLDDAQRKHILEALLRSRGKVSGKDGAAALLGVNDKTLGSRMEKLGIGRNDYLRL